MLPYSKGQKPADDPVAKGFLVDGATIIGATAIICFVLFLCFWVVPEALGFHKEPVNINYEKCDCQCWDGYFKAPHGRGAYKSFFFNMDKNMMKIAFVGIFFLILFERLVSKCLMLVVTNPKQLDFVVLTLICLNFYSNFYGVWCLINYYNDRFNKMFWNQVYFTTTELAAAIGLTMIVDKSFKRKRVCYWVIFLVSFAHLVVANIDQMFINFLPGASKIQGSRDTVLMLGDLSCLAYAAWFLRVDPVLRRRGPALCMLMTWLVVNVALDRIITSAQHTTWDSPPPPPPLDAALAPVINVP